MPITAPPIDRTIYLRIFLLTIQVGVIGIVFLLGLVVSSELKQSEKNKPEEQFFCGVIDVYPVRYRGNSPLIDSTADVRLGKKIWNKNTCGSCHNRNMKNDATGPALARVTERWSEYPKEDLYAWIRNSQELIEKKHPRALVLWESYGPTVMSDYRQLTDAEINHLLAYIEASY